MAEMELELDLAGPMRKAMIHGLADMVDALPQYRYALILELLRRDDIGRCIIAEELGETAVREHLADMEAAAIYAANKGEGCAQPIERSWDDIALELIERLQDTPGGRGEAA